MSSGPETFFHAFRRPVGTCLYDISPARKMPGPLRTTRHVRFRRFDERSNRFRPELEIRFTGAFLSGREPLTRTFRAVRKCTEPALSLARSFFGVYSACFALSHSCSRIRGRSQNERASSSQPTHFTRVNRAKIYRPLSSSFPCVLRATPHRLLLLLRPV